MRQVRKASAKPGDPLWYKDAIIYEVHVRAFSDSDGDGVGDFRGLTEKLDYIQDLGVTAIWLLPFYPSPLKDDGYDIADYTDVHPAYGTLHDFQVFLREARRRNLRVITELVLNHTSDRHPWFQKARRDKPGSRLRDFYVWSETPEKYKDARLIFKDFETSNWAWDPVARAYYWHRFYSHQPDLNYESPSVRRAILHVLDFWLGMGVDGLRLDAVPYLYERDGTSCENLPETHAFLKKVRRSVDEKFQDRMLLAEANQWPEDAVPYFGDGDECHMAFHFPVMPRLFMAIRTEDRFPIVEILHETPPIPEPCQWALFLRNHDELTLEMVTDEDRDYMYRVYAQDPQARINLGIRRRLAPLLGNHHRRIELMNGLLLSLPGTPVIYYGDEIGMGDNIYLGDRNGVRTPMQWSADRNAGFSRANPQRLYLPIIIDPEYHYEAVNVEAQQTNPHSRLWWMKRLIALRKRYKAFGHGSLEFLHPENRKVLAFLRRYREECILVLANLSRFTHCVELDLSAFKGMVPVEIFGRTEFPRIGEQPYFFTLGPHTFYWFALERLRVEEPAAAAPEEARLPILAVSNSWEAVFREEAKIALEEILPAYLQASRWFGGKARQVKTTKVLDTVDVPSAPRGAVLAMVEIRYTEGESELYALPLTYGAGETAAQELGPHAAIARLRLTKDGRHEDGILFDALWDKGFCLALLEAVARRRHLKGAFGELLASPTQAFRRIRGPAETRLEPAIMKAEQSNTSVVYGDRLVLKVFRRLDQGINPDLEIGRFLTEQAAFAHIPPVAGALEYRRGRSEPITVAVLEAFIPNQGDAWRYTLDALEGYFERALASSEMQVATLPKEPLLSLCEQDPPPLLREISGPYLASAELLGRRTAELHMALSQESEDAAFAPEPMTDFYRQSLYHALVGAADRALQLLRQRLKEMPRGLQADAKRVLDLDGEIRKRFRQIRDRKIAAMRIRGHGDYHLGQVLYTGKDFVIIDFEGEPARPLSERRLKRSPLRDVAGMLRSFRYATRVALVDQAATGLIHSRPEAIAGLEVWGRFWTLWVSAVFLKAYLAVAGETPLIPRNRGELQVLLDAFLLEKAVYELAYELNNRPDWVRIPIQGILELLEGEG